MTGVESKHVPQIAVPKGLATGKTATVTVKVGKVAHPMIATHYIQWIELYLDGTQVGRVTLKPGDKPQASFQVTPTGKGELRALISCNVHGLWENTVPIEPK